MLPDRFQDDRLDPGRAIPIKLRVQIAPHSPAMTHIAIQEKLDGKVVDWMEKVIRVRRHRRSQRRGLDREGLQAGHRRSLG
jgi:hypothetical protein